ncbi:MAG: nitroreductase family protein [Eubacteriales bacterium]
MEFRDLLMKRRSCRSFTGGTMTRSQLDYILTAATRAPNACNMQSWHFTAVCGKEAVGKLYPEVCHGEWVKNAAVVIVVSTDREGVERRFGERGRDLFSIQDTACAMDNLLLAAADLGFGGCFVGAFDEDACRKQLGLGDRYRPVALAVIGTVEGEVPLRERKPMEEVVDIVGELPEDGNETKEEETKPFELRGAYLPGAVFDDLYLGNAVFNNICFTNAKFSDINFTGASFGGLCMNQTSFGCVDMNHASFENPDLTGTTFKNCTLKNVRIEDCDLDGLTIDGVEIQKLLKK